MNALIYLPHIVRLSILLLDLSAKPSNMGDEPRADISAKWEFDKKTKQDILGFGSKLNSAYILRYKEIKTKPSASTSIFLLLL